MKAMVNAKDGVHVLSGQRASALGKPAARSVPSKLNNGQPRLAPSSRACPMQLHTTHTSGARSCVPRGRLTPMAAASTRESATSSTSNTRESPSTSQPGFKIQLLQPYESTNTPKGTCDKLLVFIPGTDGTGQAILPQIPALQALGYDIWCLYIPPQDRSGWSGLSHQTTILIRQLTQQWKAGGQQDNEHTIVDVDSVSSMDEDGNPVSGVQVTILAESFGACVALRVAREAPELISHMVLLNPATSFNESLGGFTSLITATNLPAVFPENLYAVCQATLLPFLVDTRRVSARSSELLRKMVFMTPPMSRQKLAFSPPGKEDGFYAPSQAANFRTNLLRTGNLAESELEAMRLPTLLITSAKDKMLPAIQEGARLLKLLPNARRVILPDSGHAALLEEGVSVAKLIEQVQEDLEFVQDVKQNQVAIKMKHDQLLLQNQQSIAELRTNAASAEVHHKWLEYRDAMASQL